MANKIRKATPKKNLKKQSAGTTKQEAEKSNEQKLFELQVMLAEKLLPPRKDGFWR